MNYQPDPASGVQPETGAAPAGPGAAAETPVRLRVAQVFDGRGPNGGVLIKRPPVPEAEFDALTRYLTTAPVALATTRTAADELSPDAGMAVPRAYHTDGYWIWPAAVGYYLHRYQLPPQPDLVAHIRARGFEVGAVPEPLRQAAAAQMLEELAAARRSQTPATPQVQGRAREEQQAEPDPERRQEPARAQARGEWQAEPGRESARAREEQAGAAEAEPENESARQPAASSLWLPEPAIAEPDVPEAAAPDADTPDVDVSDEPQESGPAPTPTPSPKPTPAPAPAVPVDGVLPVVSFSRALTEIGNRHACWVFEQIEAFLAFMPVDDWTVDHDSRQYRQAGRQFAVDALGRLAEDGRWVWAWAEPEAWSADPRITARVRALCAQGGGLGIAELAAPVLDLSVNADADDAETAAEMLAWSVMGLAGARGYIGHSQGGHGRIYYLAFDEAIPSAKPELGAVPRYLTQGVLKFEEDATDCVLGYIEHHGWEWSRSADGIEVSAGGLGSFTADLSADGALTGISLH